MSPDCPIMPDTNFKDLSDGDFVLKLKDIGKSLESHPAYQEGVPAWVPGAQRFYRHADDLTTAIAAAQRDRSKEQDKVAERKRGQQSINFAVQYIHMYSVHHDDPTALEIGCLGMKQKHYTKEARRALPGRLERLEILEVKDDKGEETDRLLVVVGRIPDKGSAELQYNDDPSYEASWKTLCHLYECRSQVEKRGLQRVKKYFFRARYNTAGGSGPWSEVVKHIVL